MIINAADFGLKGKRKWADTKALQRALDIAKTQEKVTIQIPKGEYHIRRSLKIYEGTTLLLDDETVLKRIGKDALLKMDVS